MMFRSVTGLSALGERYTPTGTAAGRSVSLQQAFGAARTPQAITPYSSVSNIGSQMANMLGGTNGGTMVSPRVSPRASLMPSLPSTGRMPFLPSTGGMPSLPSVGGLNGGNIGATTSAPTALGASTLTGLGSSIGKAGVNITNTLGSYIPLAIKVVLAVIVLKIVFGLISRRRR